MNKVSFAHWALCGVALLWCGCAKKDAPREAVSADGSTEQVERVQPAAAPSLAMANPTDVETDVDTGAPGGVSDAARAATAEAAGDADDASVLHMLQHEPIVKAAILSRRSLALKLSFKNGTHAAFKPIRLDNETARYEAAFYRYAKLLGIPGVPPSTMRRLSFAQLERFVARQNPELAERLKNELAVDRAGRVAGAVIQWVNDMQPSGLDEKDSILPELLSQPSAHPLSRAAVEMVVIDYTGSNWDRYTGGNLFVLDEGTKLVLLDNDNAFSRLSERQFERLEDSVAALQWIPSDLLAKITALDAAQIAEAVACEDCDMTLLYSGEIERILARRDLFLAQKKSLQRQAP